MSNLEKYKKAFTSTFDINEDAFQEDIQYNSIPEWDSIGHMSLISELEEAFDIMIETDDVIEFSSFSKGKEILKKYDITID